MVPHAVGQEGRGGGRVEWGRGDGTIGGGGCCSRGEVVG